MNDIKELSKLTQLICNHVFCQDCIKEIKKDDMITCPICRSIHNIKKEIIKNIPKSRSPSPSRCPSPSSIINRTKRKAYYGNRPRTLKTCTLVPTNNNSISSTDPNFFSKIYRSSNLKHNMIHDRLDFN